MVQIETVFGIIEKNSILFSIVLAIAMIWMTLRRTKSDHLVMMRLWRLFHGAKICAIAEIQTALDAQTAVMQFRFITGLRVRTDKKIASLVLWAQQNDEDLGDVAACGPYFDLEAPGLKSESELPTKPFMVLLMLAIIALVSGCVFFAGGAIVDRAVLQMKETSIWFTLDAASAKPLWGGKGFLLKECTQSTSTLAAASGFSKNDVEVICKASANNQVADFVESTVHSQRIVFSLFFTCLAYMLMNIFRRVSWVSAAHEMRKRLVSENTETIP